MNGKITVQSKLGAGSTFTITLPLKIANAGRKESGNTRLGSVEYQKLEGKRFFWQKIMT